MHELPTPGLETERLVLSPLRVEDAADMVGVLADTALYEFTGGDPPGLVDLETRYAAQVVGPAASGEIWHNWILRLRDSDRAVGFVQATVTGDEADVAWVVGTAWQRRGLATEATVAMCRWFRDTGIDRLTAHINPSHVASERVAAAVGLEKTDEIDDDGEVVWSSP